MSLREEPVDTLNRTLVVPDVTVTELVLRTSSLINAPAPREKHIRIQPSVFVTLPQTAASIKLIANHITFRMVTPFLQDM